MARKLKDKDLQKYGSRTSAVKSDMDKPTASMKGLDDAVSKIGAKTKQGMSDAGSFGSAFKAARSSGDKTFTWHGKSYSTKTAGDKPSTPAKRAAPAAKPAASKPAASKPAAPAPAKRTEAPRSAGPMKSGFKSAMGPSASSDFSNAKIPSRLNPANKSAPAKASRPSVADVTRTDIAGRKVDLSPDKKRKLQEAINRSGARSGFAKGGSIDGCAVRGKTKAR